MSEQEIKSFLLSILEDLIEDKISKEDAVCKLSCNHKLTEQVAEKDVSLSISDCYWLIAHLTEENATNVEIQYFIDCYRGRRKYNLQEKLFRCEAVNLCSLLESEISLAKQGANKRNIGQLRQIISEVQKMVEISNCKVFSPFYPNAITDSWRFDDPVAKRLLNLVALYEKIGV